MLTGAGDAGRAARCGSAATWRSPRSTSAARASTRPPRLKEALTRTGGDNVMVGGQPRHVVSYMKDFLFAPEQAGQPVGALSGGERGRLMLARALATPSNLLVLDEPTNDLDLETLDLLQEMVADYPGTVILVSHDRDFLDRTVTSILAAEGDGRWVEYAGGYSDMLAQRGGAHRARTAEEAAPRRESSKAAAGPARAEAKAQLQGQARAADAAGDDRPAARRDRPAAAAARRSGPVSAATPPPSTAPPPISSAPRPSSPRPRRNGCGWSFCAKPWKDRLTRPARGKSAAARGGRGEAFQSPDTLRVFRHQPCPDGAVRRPDRLCRHPADRGLQDARKPISGPACWSRSATWSSPSRCSRSPSSSSRRR